MLLRVMLVFAEITPKMPAFGLGLPSISRLVSVTLVRPTSGVVRALMLPILMFASFSMLIVSPFMTTVPRGVSIRPPLTTLPVPAR
ncbi:hypothetical protein ES703_20632 [subsurface metagenome]